MRAPTQLCAPPNSTVVWLLHNPPAQHCPPAPSSKPLLSRVSSNSFSIGTVSRVSRSSQHCSNGEGAFVHALGQCPDLVASENHTQQDQQPDPHKTTAVQIKLETVQLICLVDGGTIHRFKHDPKTAAAKTVQEDRYRGEEPGILYRGPAPLDVFEIGILGKNRGLFFDKFGAGTVVREKVGHSKDTMFPLVPRLYRTFATLLQHNVIVSKFCPTNTCTLHDC